MQLDWMGKNASKLSDMIIEKEFTQIKQENS